MKHLFVPYELAVLLKKKGFDEPCFGGYEQEGNTFRYYTPNTFLNHEMGLQHKEHLNHVNSNLINRHCTAPLWQQVIDWLSENHSIDIIKEVNTEKGWFQYRIYQHEPRYDHCASSKNKTEVLKDAIKQALTLIEHDHDLNPL